MMLIRGCQGGDCPHAQEGHHASARRVPIDGCRRPVGNACAARAAGRCCSGGDAGDGHDLTPLIAEWFETTIAGDGQAFAALYTPQGVHEDTPANTVARGPDELAAYVDEFTTQQEDLQVQVRAVHRTDDGAVVEYTGMSTDVASGQRVTVPVVTIFEMEGDHIRRSADYYDVAGILGQLGVLDMGEAT